MGSILQLEVSVLKLQDRREPASGAANDVENLTQVGADRLQLAMLPDLHCDLVRLRSGRLETVLRSNGPTWVLLGWDFVAPHRIREGLTRRMR